MSVRVEHELAEHEPSAPSGKVAHPANVESPIAFPRHDHRNAQPVVDDIRLVRPVDEGAWRTVGGIRYVLESLEKITVPVPVEERRAVAAERQFVVVELPVHEVVRPEDAFLSAVAGDELEPAVGIVVDAGVLRAGDDLPRFGEMDAIFRFGVRAADRIRGILRQAARVQSVGEMEFTVLDERRAGAQRLPPFLDRDGMGMFVPFDKVGGGEVGEVVPSGSAARPVVPPVEKIEHVEASTPQTGRHVAHPRVGVVGRPVLDGSRDAP